MASIRTISDATVGDTIYHKDKPVEALPGFRPAKPMVTIVIFLCPHIKRSGTYCFIGVCLSVCLYICPSVCPKLSVKV